MLLSMQGVQYLDDEIKNPEKIFIIINLQRFSWR